MKSSESHRLALAVAAVCALFSGCTDARKERLAGAQHAIESLPEVELVSTDTTAGVLTVRDRRTGSVTTVDVMAKAPAAAAPPGGGAPAEPHPPVEAQAGSADALPAGSSAAVTSGIGAPLLNAGEAARPLGEAAESATQPADTTAGMGSDAATGPDGAIVVRDRQGRVQKIQGSGFSIERTASGRSEAGERAALPGANARPNAAASEEPAAAGTRRRLDVPFVCGPDQSRSLQGVEVVVSGAGIVAERGCTLTLANVRVRSGGWGLVVNPGAKVRIDDSLIEGRTGALDLHPGGSLSAWATTFRGALGRPVAPPQFVDRGGNTWD